MLSTPSLRKLFREEFCAEPPLSVDLGDREKLGEEILKRLLQLEGVTKSSPYRPDSDKDRFVCSFGLADPDPKSRYYSSTEFRLLVSEAGELTIRAYGLRSTVASIAELESFCRAYRQRGMRRMALRKRREKVRQIKTQAVIARVKKMARELEVDFATISDTQKLKLLIRLAENKAVQLEIPYTKFEEILPQIKPMIVTLRDLHATGINFKIVGQAEWAYRTRWISYKEE